MVCQYIEDSTSHAFVMRYCSGDRCRESKRGQEHNIKRENLTAIFKMLSKSCTSGVEGRVHEYDVNV